MIYFIEIRIYLTSVGPLGDSWSGDVVTPSQTQPQIVSKTELLARQEGLVLQAGGQQFSDGVLAVSHGQVVQHLVNLVKATALLVETVREASRQISEKVRLAQYLSARCDDQSGLLHLSEDDRQLQLGLGPPHTGRVDTEGGREGGRGERGVLVGGDVERAVLGQERQEVLQGERGPARGTLDHQTGPAGPRTTAGLHTAGQLHTASLGTEVDSLLEDLQSAGDFVKTFGEQGDLSLHPVIGLVQPTQGVPPHHTEVHAVSNQVSDVVQAVLDHGGSLQAEPPGDHVHVLGQPHGEQHLGSEDPTVTDLHPLGQTLVVAEYLHAGLGVRVVGGLEPELLYAELLEELMEDPDKITQGEASVSYDALNLVELCQVCVI